MCLRVSIGVMGVGFLGSWMGGMLCWEFELFIVWNMWVLRMMFGLKEFFVLVVLLL